MTQLTDKELAEFAAEYLELAPIEHKGFNLEWNGTTYSLHIKDVIHNQYFAPILMHLAMEKAEGEGTSWALEHFYYMREKRYLYKTTIWHDDDNEINWNDKNKFRAFWTALMKAKGAK